ncbi:MAG: FAD-binding oxidoreductase [Pseudomonadota bacterium]
MDRRTLIKLMAAAAVSGCAGQSTAPRPLRVVVAGAGIIGAAVAYHLAKAGAVVTVIDQEGPASHASRGTFAWINATWAKQPRSYHQFSQQGVAGWGGLQRALKLPVRWGGSLEWFTDASRQARLVQQIEEQVAWGEPARMLSALEIAELEPHLQTTPGMSAAFSPNDGALDPVLATRSLLEAAVQMRATLRYPCTLNGVAVAQGRLTAVETSIGVIPADRLVLATGAAADIPARVAGIDIPQRSTPGVIVLTKPMRRLLQRIVVAPGVHMHQRDDGRIVLGEQDGPPPGDAHQQRLAGRPNNFPNREFAHQHARRILAIAEQFVPGVANAEVDAVHVGWRPLPLDGHPVLGANPERRDIYLAIMHSGVSLAPIVGQLVARELVDDLSLEQLALYRPTRAFERVRRY